MSLILYYHPLASYCHKVLIPLYENGTAFEPQVVDLSDAESSAELLAAWPVGKFPVIKDTVRDVVVHNNGNAGVWSAGKPGPSSSTSMISEPPARRVTISIFPPPARRDVP